MATITIELDQADAAYTPGQAMTGRVAWDLEHKAEAIVVRQAWKTNGRGEQDIGLGGEQRLTCHTREGEATFELPALDGPYSYQGKLFGIRWMLEVTAEPHGPKAWQAFTLSPTRSAIRA
ncbi:MAG: hypothetical protein AAGB26_09420 [Planctomycetota bacterium]